MGAYFSYLFSRKQQSSLQLPDEDESRLVQDFFSKKMTLFVSIIIVIAYILIGIIFYTFSENWSPAVSFLKYFQLKMLGCVLFYSCNSNNSWLW